MRVLATFERAAGLGRVLVVALGMELEVRGRGRPGLEPVVRDEPVELRRRDRRLARLDRIENRGGAELVVRSGPRGGAAACLGQRLVPVAAERGSEVVPERDVRSLLLGVQACRSGRAGQRDDGVAVLAGVARQLITRQLPALPAHVERMLE